MILAIHIQAHGSYSPIMPSSSNTNEWVESKNLHCNQKVERNNNNIENSENSEKTTKRTTKLNVAEIKTTRKRKRKQWE